MVRVYTSIKFNSVKKPTNFYLCELSIEYFGRLSKGTGSPGYSQYTAMQAEWLVQSTLISHFETKREVYVFYSILLYL